MKKLNQVLAVEKGVKSESYSQITGIHKTNQKPDLFSGFSRSYRRINDEGEDYPAENKKVQLQAEDVIKNASMVWTKMFDVTATKDWGNMKAVADVKVGDKVLIKGAPVPFLLFLEKQLNDVRKFVETLPTLDEADDWVKDGNAGLFRTGTISTHRTKKVQKPIVLYDATDKHPAQTQLLTEDVLVGYWDTTKLSGAIPAPRKKLILANLEAFSNAVKMAREEANGVLVDDVSVGHTIFDYLFA